MLEHGVRYPGRQLNHRLAVNAFMGRGFGWDTGGAAATGAPKPARWHELKREIEAETERHVWFGHEYASSSTDEQCARWVEELGPRLQVVITLRPFGNVLPSLWQESLKRNAGRQRYESWLSEVLQPKLIGSPERIVRHDHATLVRRWAQAAGPGRVTIVALDPADPGFLYRSFEDLLGLPAGLLQPNAGPRAGNRSFTVAEAELARRLNAATRKAGLEWINHEWLLFHGAIGQLLERAPEREEAQLRLPDWALALARAQEKLIVEEVQGSGVRVVGDVANLRSREPGCAYADPSAAKAVPIRAAVDAMVGLVSAASGRDRSFQRRFPLVKRKLRAELIVNLPAMLQVLRRSR
jgi:hypothetical protein